jgi:hypothetical protein
MWTHNRVKEILTAIKWVVGGVTTYPIYHIESSMNIADIVTKPRQLYMADIDRNSLWQTGMQWMQLPSDQLPKTQVKIPTGEKEQHDFESELFPEIYTREDQEDQLLFLSTENRTASEECRVPYHCGKGPQDSDEGEVNVNTAHAVTSVPFKVSWLADHVGFEQLGWQRARDRVKGALSYLWKLRHRVHQKGKFNLEGCCYCMTNPDVGIEKATERTILRAASKEAEANEGSRRLDQNYTKSDGVWYSHSRLEKEGPVEIRDVDTLPFYDVADVKKILPVVMVRSPLFKAHMAYVHDRQLNHAGVENTLKGIKEMWLPIGGPVRATILSYRKSCSNCRRRLKEVVKMELADFPSCRTTVAPPFYFIQVDIAMAFKAKPFKESRKSLTAHALVIVCMVTSATSILVLDGLSTQAVVQALERHAARYGMPGEVHVDSGSQLEKLRDTNFNIRNVHGQEYRGMKFKVVVSTPKAHQEHGRVERKIRTLREMLEKLFSSTEVCNTMIGWETLFARIASQIDDLPIARGSATAATDLGWEIITPNRLKIGRNSHKNLDGPVVLEDCPQSQLDRSNEIFSAWYRIYLDRLHLLIPKSEKIEDRKVKIGDVVLFVFQDAAIPKLGVWKLGRVVELVSTHSVKIMYTLAGGPKKYLVRSIRQLTVIVGIEEFNSKTEQGSATVTDEY